eukprot:gnl/TRDRNA2_/TRDRNA2_176599_c2_seq1.p1 gnl/TRDRNA2_/TRDRNA2_176599_c2~~gnl/TRDRNA2_/TRDRNA2_176599_c2_seq1.p1  ORF type:complete len:240 (+),score=70.45 gnl/TRDRNA2_/TRDRNA2_176599_c2_seq1:93-812(+)
MSLEHLPQLGSKPVALTVKLPAIKNSSQLSTGIREFYRKGEFADVALICAGQTFLAHRVVLAAQSHVFGQGLEVPAGQQPNAPGGRQEIRLAEIANPEAVKFMLDYMYEMDSEGWQNFNPRTQEINKDVLRLAQQFNLPGLTERAKYWLSQDLHTGNVVERLDICDEFRLSDLYMKILEQLNNNKKALSEISNCPQIMEYPKLMQALLQQASHCPADPKSSPEKSPEKPVQQPKKKAKR